MKKLSLLLLTLVFAFAFVACGETTTEAPVTQESTTTEEPHEVYDNETDTLILQSSTMDGVFNPFFASSAYDMDVTGLVNVSLLSINETGSVVAGDDYPSLAQSYNVYYTDDLTTYAEKSTYVEGDYVVYDIVLKNGAMFSDGTAIDADDVLFNYYTYLDPSYNGSSTLYTLPIKGLLDYRTQVAGSEAFLATVEAIIADDTRHAGFDSVTADGRYTEAEHDLFWDSMDTRGVAFAQEISDYVNTNYLIQDYVDAYSGFAEGTTVADIQASAGLSMAYGMTMWGYAAEIAADNSTLTGYTGTVYTVADLTADDYWYEIIYANCDENGQIDFAGGYQGLSDYESAGSDFVGLATQDFITSKASGEAVPSIAGLMKGTTTVDGVSHETIRIVLSQQNPKAILSLGVTVTPQHYYTAGYTPAAEAIVNYGVEFDSAAFMTHLASFNAEPRGAGTYNFVEVAADETVYFVRNEYFETMGGDNVYNATIKNVALKIVSSGSEYPALEAGDVHYATVSATADVMVDVAAADDLDPILVDNLGYGYINLHPQTFTNIHERIALVSVMDLEKIKNYYPNGLADVIYRSMSQVSWAYPEGAEAVYPFDSSMATAIAELQLAGYTWDATNEVFTDVPAYTFTLPSETDAHPAGAVFLEAQRLLATIGVTANIATDESLIANIKAGVVDVYALAWGSAMDPDMYQVNHYESQAESVISNGIKWLQANGNDDTLGTIDVVKLDNSTETMNQAEALEYLAYLIEEGVKYMLPEERAPIYAKALEVLAQLAIELPTYQRKNLFVYNSSVIDPTTMSSTVTPYWGPLAEIWKLSLIVD